MEEEKDENQLKIVEQINNFPTQEEKDQLELEKKQVEAAFQAAQKKSALKKKVFKILGAVFVVLLMITAGLAVYFRSRNADNSTPVKKQVAVEIPKEQNHVFVNDGIVDTDGNKNSDSGTSSADDLRGFAGTSESYRIKDIAIGGGSIVLAAESEGLPLKIADVHSETLMSKDGKKMELLLSWKTNKLARSEVKYAKGEKGSGKSIKDNGYGFSHALVVNNLEPSTRYLFTVSVIDRSGNIVVSDSLAAFTGSKPVSVFDLISGEMNDIFGWALK